MVFIIGSRNNSVLRSAAQLLRELYPNNRILTFQTGEATLECLKHSSSSTLCILSSDLSDVPPEKILKIIKEQNLSIPTILITQEHENALRLKALEFGVDDIIITPYTPEYFYLRVNKVLHYHHLQRTVEQLRKDLHTLMSLLDQTNAKMLQALEKIQFLVLPETQELTLKIKRIAEWIAIRFGDLSEEQLETITNGASIIHIGKIFLPDALKYQIPTINGTPTHPAMLQLPKVVDKILSPLPSLRSIRTVLYALFENYDGTGFPNQLAKSQIPIESRILRVAHDFAMLQHTFTISPLETFDRIQQQSKVVYDPRFVSLLDEYIWENLQEDIQHQIRSVHPSELTHGMVLARDLITNSGIKLLSAGTLLTEKMIERIQQHIRQDPIIGAIFIRI